MPQRLGEANSLAAMRSGAVRRHSATAHPFLPHDEPVGHCPFSAAWQKGELNSLAAQELAQ